MSEESEVIHLETYTSLLNRSQMEQLLVKCIVSNPDLFDDLEAAAKQFDEEEYLQELDRVEEKWDEESESIFDLMDTILTRASNYSLIKQHAHAVKVLYGLSNMVVMKLIEEQYDEGKLPDQLNELVGSIENLWKDIITNYQPSTVTTTDSTSKAPKSMKEIFDTLALWRTKLQDPYGPLFSDPLRIAKKLLMSDAEDQPPAKKQRNE